MTRSVGPSLACEGLQAGPAPGVSLAACVSLTLTHIHHQKVSLYRLLAFAAKAPCSALVELLLFLQKFPKEAKMWPLV